MKKTETGREKLEIGNNAKRDSEQRKRARDVGVECGGVCGSGMGGMSASNTGADGSLTIKLYLRWRVVQQIQNFVSSKINFERLSREGGYTNLLPCA